LSREDIPSLFSDGNWQPFPASGEKTLVKARGKLATETSINVDLQNYTVNLLHRSQTLRAAVIVLRPDNGQVLAMANYDRQVGGETENICLEADFPAASLFKIVASAAAIEAKDFSPDKVLYFRGKKYTLYKNQLKPYKGTYVRKATFKEAFSGSINPVFGKIGIYDLGRDLLAEYADRFHFNHEIPFDLPLAKSRIQVPGDAFGLAEIASGFNKKTLISPLHAALITATVANAGIMMKPWLVKAIKDESNGILYEWKPSSLSAPITEETAKTLKILMKETVRRGTCRKAFYPLRRKKLFKNIELGAKTGTINDPLDQFKFDWVTAFALPSNGNDGICIAVLAVHGEKLGVRAKDIARYIINHHFYRLRKEI
jgi:cell division protein FtsI/penicillin-binding protein 2